MLGRYRHARTHFIVLDILTQSYHIITQRKKTQRKENILFHILDIFLNLSHFHVVHVPIEISPF